MRIKVLNHQQNYIYLPLADAKLNFEMRRKGIHETIPKCKLVEVSENDNPLGQLEGQILNMDEVNFFARRMESLTEYEQKVLSVYAENHGVNNMKDLTNLTYSTKGLSLITDFSDPEQVGKRLYMDEMQAMSADEEKHIDFVQIAEKAFREGRVEVMPCGVFVEHGFALQEVYSGKTFPEYACSDKIVATVEVKNKAGDTEYLYLPTDICSMNKVKERLGVLDFWEMKVTGIHNMKLPDILVPIPEDVKEILQLTLFNEMCQTVSRFDEVQMKKLAMVVEFIGYTGFAEVTSLAKNLGEFEINPFVHNDEEYGRYWVTQSGLYDVDDLLLPHIDYASFAKDKKDGTLVVSGYVRDGFVGATRPLAEYQQYEGEFADPLELDYDCFENFYLFSPLTAILMVEEMDARNLSGSDLTQYKEEIMAAIAREACVGEEVRGLMHYFDEDRNVARTVLSAYPQVTEINGELYGVLACKIIEPLEKEDVEILKDYWSGQMSDGWGESFEKYPIHIEDGEIYVSFWSDGKNWSIMTEEELMGGQSQGMDLYY